MHDEPGDDSPNESLGDLKNAIDIRPTAEFKHEDPSPTRGGRFDRLRDLLGFLKGFATDPIGTMRRPLRLSWPAAISLQAGAAMVSGALAGAASRNFFDVIVGLVVFPASSIVIGFVVSLFFYYFFIAFQSTYLDYRRLHSIVAVSLLPYFLLHAFSGFLPPIDLLGFALSALLLIVGLVEQFGVHRKYAIRLLGGIYLAFFIVWMIVIARGTAS